jgi:hypothetical protein
MSPFDCGSQAQVEHRLGAGSVRRNPSVISRCGDGFDTALGEEAVCPALFHSTSPPKRALLCVSTASRLVAARLASGAPGSWWCKHRDRRGADSENKAMATKQTSKQAKTKAEVRVDRSANNRPVDNSEHEPRHPNRRARSQSGAVRTDRAEATGAAAPNPNLNGSEVFHKPERARSSSKAMAEQADLRTTAVELPPATTKRAQLIGLLERPEGATVAEIGQRLRLAAAYRAGCRYRPAQSRSRGDAKQGCR